MLSNMGLGSPVLSQNTYERPSHYDNLVEQGGPDVMAARTQTASIGGTVIATGIMLSTLGMTAMLTFGFLQNASGGLSMGLIAGSAILGLILTLVISFKPNLAPALGLPFAVVEGVFVGAISLFYASWAGAQQSAAAGTGGSGGVVASLDTSIVFQAGLLTFGIAAGLLVAYSTRIIRVSNALMKGIFAATIGVVVLMAGMFLLRLFGVQSASLWAMGPLGIGIAGVIVVIAAANLLVDFRVIEDGVNAGAPKYMNWYGGFAVLVTLVWLYISILRLLALLRNSD
ncbi:MAG: Bax inhibitor-1/YccA family protein [Planctomycetota bacterium]